MDEVVGPRPGRLALGVGPAPPQRVRLAKRPVGLTATLWGEGFADDDVFSAVRVDHWSDCSSDEYIFLFPNLVARGGRLPDPLMDHITRCVTARAWRAEARGAAVSLTSVPAHDVSRLGPELHDDWFAASASATAKQPAGTDRLACDEDEALSFLDRLLSRERNGGRAGFDETDAVRLAFLTGIHPAYLWPEAALSHELYTAAGWLGHLHRGRRARMPSTLASYFLDVLVTADDGMPVCRDERLSVVLADPAAMRIVRRAATRRETGREAITRSPSGRSSWRRLFALFYPANRRSP